MIKERRIVLPTFYFPISHMTFYAIICVLSGFAAGFLVTFLMMTRTVDHNELVKNYANLTQKISEVGIECARPQTGQVTITSTDVVDAISGKQMEFVVETEITDK